MAHPISLVIIDDHPTFRLGLKQILAGDSSFHVIGEADDGQSGLQLIRELKPSIAIIDLNLPKMNGLDLVRACLAHKLGTRIIIITTHHEESWFHAALDAGVNGYVLKDNAIQDILKSVRSVAAGGIYISPIISGYLIKRNLNSASLQREKPGLKDLTPMQRRVLKLIADNKTSREIAKEIGISHRTVEVHRSNICQKLDLHGNHPLLQFALFHRSEL